MIEWTPEVRRLEQMATTLLQRVNPLCAIRYLSLDGHFGTNNVMQMVRQSLALHLISKLRNDAALYFRDEGPPNAVGAPKRYGPKIAYDQIPTKYLVERTTEKGIQTDIYQATMLHKAFADALNVVVLVKTNLVTQQKAHVVRFSSDLGLAYAHLIAYYRLRFQIEFNFRDAKQFWGFEDFMNVKQTPVTNAVGLAFLMVNLSHILLAHFRRTIPDFSVLDLKALFRARRFAREAFKLLPHSLDPLLIAQVLDAMPPLGAIHAEPVLAPYP
jgi:putative transposase